MPKWLSHPGAPRGVFDKIGMRNGNTFLLKVKESNFVLNETSYLERNGLGQNLNAKGSCRRFMKGNLWKGILGVIRMD